MNTAPTPSLAFVGATLVVALVLAHMSKIDFAWT